MTAVPSILISDRIISTNSVEQLCFYLALLAAIAEKASELRFESGGEYDKVWCKVNGVDYEMAPVPKGSAENELLMLANFLGEQGKGDTDQIRLRLGVWKQTIELVAHLRPSDLIIQLLSPVIASEEAAAMLMTHVKRLKES